MDNLAWSNGIKPERSLKKNNPALINIEAKNNIQQIEENSNINNITWDYKLNNMETINTFELTDNRREIFNEKLSSRSAISKACGNPFLTHLNYSNDIIQQQRFLIPKNSNMEKEYNR